MQDIVMEYLDRLMRTAPSVWSTFSGLVGRCSQICMSLDLLIQGQNGVFLVRPTEHLCKQIV